MSKQAAFLLIGAATLGALVASSTTYSLMRSQIPNDTIAGIDECQVLEYVEPDSKYDLQRINIRSTMPPNNELECIQVQSGLQGDEFAKFSLNDGEDVTMLCTSVDKI